MAAIDIRALRWTNLFRDIPQYPDLLTQRHWDSNKGKIAKMAGHTGIGDQMKATAAAFKKLEGKWVFIQGTRPVDVEKEKDDAISLHEERADQELSRRIEEAARPGNEDS